MTESNEDFIQKELEDYAIRHKKRLILRENSQSHEQFNKPYMGFIIYFMVLISLSIFSFVFYDIFTNGI